MGLMSTILFVAIGVQVVALAGWGIWESIRRMPHHEMLGRILLAAGLGLCVGAIGLVCCFWVPATVR
jgi:hypothetical protein